MTKAYAEMFSKLITDIYSNSSECPVCHKHFSQMDEVAFIRHNGMCLNCDNIRADVDEQMLNDAKEMETYAQPSI